MSITPLLTIATILVAVDSIYLYIIKDYFQNQIQIIQQTPVKINYLGAAICYFFLAIGLNYFIIQPKKTMWEAFLLGLVIYGVYESTNYALFSKWAFTTVAIDTLWGGALFAISTYIIQYFQLKTI